MREKPEKPFKTSAPFGIAVKRFARIGFHPDLDVSGAFKKEITKCGPGSYYPKNPECKYKAGVSWDKKIELEEYSKYLGFRNADVLADRLLYKSLRGPGTNDIDENLYRQKTSSVAQNKGLGSAPKFAKEYLGRSTPPPNTYQRKRKLGPESSKKTFSNTPTFEWDGLQNRFKSDTPKYHLPSNLYVYNDGKNTVDITQKVVSTRGPYDLFTGPRDQSTIKNHFAAPLSQGRQYFYVRPSDIQVLLHHPSKQRFGMFLKGPRVSKKPTSRNMLTDIALCYHDPDDPGPAHYEVRGNRYWEAVTLTCISITKKPPALHPFDSSKNDARPPTDWRISPGPGRYTPKEPRCMKIKRPSCVFLSTQKREYFKVLTYKLF